MRICAVIPTFNNDRTLSGVIDDVLRHIPAVIVVNDGSTDRTAEILDGYGNRIILISYPTNRGKGYALRKAFRYALCNGFTHAVAIDSDGQHFAGDIPGFLATVVRRPEALIIGNRNLSQENMPRKNTFANRFSNFWFTVQTTRRLADTQTGFRLYPLEKVGKMHLFTRRYETELEILVRSAWNGIPFVSIPVGVRYAPDRVTHFRPFADFARISMLNTIFCLLAIVYGYPKMLAASLGRYCQK
ncbi:MAG: glycosyltransferase family 2 protein [Bacteroidales bacterium]|jgi:glycosyltransferase involved in cell wall biosynthesis|nr:glycosyltransferase family 2 protein [Bacteroidales bacterium]